MGWQPKEKLFTKEGWLTITIIIQRLNKKNIRNFQLDLRIRRLRATFCNTGSGISRGLLKVDFHDLKKEEMENAQVSWAGKTRRSKKAY